MLRSLGHDVLKLGGGPPLLDRLRNEKPDFVFNIAEGHKGRSREAHVPALLELLDIPYSGSDPLTLAATLDKPTAKRLVASVGVPTAPFTVIDDSSTLEEIEWPPFPVVAKPAWEGSSKGIRAHSMVGGPEELRELIPRLAELYQQPVLIESFLPGEELTVGLLGNGRPSVVGVMRIGPAEGPVERFMYSIEAKREWRRRVRYESPPKLDRATVERVREHALAAYEVLGCRDVARIDFRLDAAGEPCFLEANPLPGLSPEYGDLPIMARLNGWQYEALVEAILVAALERYGMAG